MRDKLISLFSVIILTLLIIGCAGTKQSDSMASGNATDDQELQDIEALLGITTDEDEKQESKQPSREEPREQLELLKEDDVLNKDQDQSSSSSLAAATMYQEMESEEKTNYEEQIKKLKRDLNQKDLEIADLKTQLRLQQEDMTMGSGAASGAGFSGVVSSVSTEEYQSRYDEARSAFEARNYELAAQLFQSLLSASTSHALSDNAQFWIGESHYALKQYDAAVIDFEKVFTFPKSNKNDDAQFKLGVCYLRKGDRVKASEELERLITNYPNSEFVERANSLLMKISG